LGQARSRLGLTVVNLKPRDVFKVLEPDGSIADPGHPFVILLISEDMALFSNITDAEKEDDVPCLLRREDDPKLLTKDSTFRYQSIKDWPLSKLARAFANRKLLYCGQLSEAAFQKILAGAATARLIKPRYRVLMQAFSQGT
jgi:hypothetical protein